jgi:predicted nucleotidyltransferase
MKSVEAPNNIYSNETQEFPGVTLEQIRALAEIFSCFEKVESARIFGSRVTGKHKPDSDLDVALKTARGFKGFVLTDIYDRVHSMAMERTGLDVHLKLIEDINNPALIRSIEREGFTIYKKPGN